MFTNLWEAFHLRNNHLTALALSVSPPRWPPRPPQLPLAIIRHQNPAPLKPIARTYHAPPPSPGPRVQ